VLGLREKAKVQAERDARVNALFEAKLGAVSAEDGLKSKRSLDSKETMGDILDDLDEMDVDGDSGRAKGSKRALLGSLGRRLGN